MKTRVVNVTLAGLLTTAAAFAQSPTPNPSTDPSAASSPHQRAATSTQTPESPATEGNNPADASSAHQRQTLVNSQDAVSAGSVSAQSFVENAGQDGMTEVQLGKLALAKSKLEKIRTFAQEMVRDHGQANKELGAIAAQKNLRFSRGLDSKHQAAVDQMQAKNGAEFDSAYVSEMTAAHSRAVALFQAATNSRDADIAAFAAKTLPTLQKHERMADALSASLHAQAN